MPCWCSSSAEGWSWYLQNLYGNRLKYSCQDRILLSQTKPYAICRPAPGPWTNGFRLLDSAGHCAFSGSPRIPILVLSRTTAVRIPAEPFFWCSVFGVFPTFFLHVQKKKNVKGKGRQVVFWVCFCDVFRSV